MNWHTRATTSSSPSFLASPVSVARSAACGAGRRSPTRPSEATARSFLRLRPHFRTSLGCLQLERDCLSRSPMHSNEAVCRVKEWPADGRCREPAHPARRRHPRASISRVTRRSSRVPPLSILEHSNEPASSPTFLLAMFIALSSSTQAYSWNAYSECVRYYIENPPSLEVTGRSLDKEIHALCVGMKAVEAENRRQKQEMMTINTLRCQAQSITAGSTCGLYCFALRKTAGSAATPVQ